jgi:hypothetical protein
MKASKTRCTEAAEMKLIKAITGYGKMTILKTTQLQKN